MSRARVAVLKVTTHQLSVTQAAAEYGYSRRHLHRLLARYAEGGLEAVEPRSRRPASNSAATPDTVRERIVELRLQLTKDGLDAGPVTIAWHLEQEGHRPPSTSTIRRILHAAGLVVPETQTTPLLLPGASPPLNPTSAGSPTSPTGGWPTAPTSRSSTSSMTTPATYSAAPPIPRSPATW